MITIYINEIPLILATSEEAADWDRQDLRNLTINYTHQKKYLHTYVDNLEKGSDRYDSIRIVHDDLEVVLADFSQNYKLMKAAGGLVFNPDGEVLAIYRLGHWDLPKGKIEKKETPPQAAIREVEEETGIDGIALGPELCITYHTYFDERKNRKVLKKTWWYRMEAPKMELIPQTEENIEKAVWLLPQTLKNNTPIYKNILDVLSHVG